MQIRINGIVTAYKQLEFITIFKSIVFSFAHFVTLHLSVENKRTSCMYLYLEQSVLNFCVRHRDQMKAGRLNRP